MSRQRGVFACTGASSNAAPGARHTTPCALLPTTHRTAPCTAYHATHKRLRALRHALHTVHHRAVRRVLCHAPCILCPNATHLAPCLALCTAHRRAPLVRLALWILHCMLCSTPRCGGSPLREALRAPSPLPPCALILPIRASLPPWAPVAGCCVWRTVRPQAQLDTPARRCTHQWAAPSAWPCFLLLFGEVGAAPRCGFGV